MNCPHCGAATPAGVRFCMACGAELAQDNAQSGMGVSSPPPAPARSRPTREPPPPLRRGATGCVLVVLLLFLVAGIANMLGGGGSSSSPGAGTPTSATTPIGQDTPIPQDTPATTQTAAPDPAKQADLRTWVGQVFGAMKMCDDPALVASHAMGKVAVGGSVDVAVNAARAAASACDSAALILDGLALPADIDRHSLVEGRTYLSAWARLRRKVFDDAVQYFDDPSNTAARADAPKTQESASLAASLGQADITISSQDPDLGVDATKITPVIPTGPGGN